jgi:hypothetical protein
MLQAAYVAMLQPPYAAMLQAAYQCCWFPAAHLLCRLAEYYLLKTACRKTASRNLPAH